jgi:glutaconate CoA-transferase subunit B
VTPLAVLDFGGEGDGEKRLRVRSVHPGVTLAEVQERTGFAISAAPAMGETPAPSDAELAALERVDPERIRLLEFAATRAATLARIDRP